MRNIIAYFIKNPVAANVLLFLILILGFFGFRSLTYNLFPPEPTKIVAVEIVYPGASPQEIAEGVVAKIEENLEGVTGVERVTSTSQENSASVLVEKKTDYDIDLLLQDVKNAVDRISSFPVDMEPPVIFKREAVNFAINFALSGDVDLRTLKQSARTAEQDLLAMEGISKVELSGFPEEEIEIAVRENDLRTFGLTFAQVAQAVRAANLEITGGTIKTPEEELLIRSRNKEYFGSELADIIVATTVDGREVRLFEVADLRDRWADNPNRTYLNGKPAVTVTVNNTLDEDVIQIAEDVQEYVGEFNEENDVISATVIRDGSKNVRARRDLLAKNGLIGFCLVILVLALFLNLRLAFWVALALPVCFAGMFAVGSLFGLSIDVISLFGMIVVVGILVDDGIVISENIYQHWERGAPPNKAAIDGTMEVFPAVLTAIATTVAAFSLFFFVEGRTGEIFSEMAFVVIVTLIFSLLEGAFILPSHVAHSKSLQIGAKKNRLERAMNGFLNGIRDRIYAPILRFCIRYAYMGVLIPLLALFIGIGMFQGNLVRFTFFPSIDADFINATLRLPAGTREDETRAILDRIERAAWELNEELSAERPDGKQVVEYVNVNIGPTTYQGTLTLNLLDGEIRQMPAREISARLREKVGEVRQAEELTYVSARFFGKPISIALLGRNDEELLAAVAAVKDSLNAIDGVIDITDTNKEGLRELNLKLKDQARYLGLTLNEVVSQVRSGFFGAEVQRLQRGKDEIRVWVRYDESDRSSIGQLERMRIRLADGREFPLEELATLEPTRGVIAINRIDGQREIRIEADVSGRTVNAAEVTERLQTVILPSLQSRYPSVGASFEGQARNTQRVASSVQRALPILLIIMYLMAVLTFGSWGQGLLIIPLLLPFGLIGVIFGHWFHGQSISILSVLGIVALIGIMVNDSLVLIAQFNHYMRDHNSFGAAVYKAGLSRFRPILLTSLTTIVGLYPLILEKSFQAQFLIPMAIAVAYGLLFATFVILITVPSMLVLLNRYRNFTYRLWTGERGTPEITEPAIKGRWSNYGLWLLLLPLLLIAIALVVVIPFQLAFG